LEPICGIGIRKHFSYNCINISLFTNEKVSLKIMGQPTFGVNIAELEDSAAKKPKLMRSLKIFAAETRPSGVAKILRGNAQNTSK
jgi:hypothetical protein